MQIPSKNAAAGQQKNKFFRLRKCFLFGLINNLKKENPYLLGII